MGYYTRFSLTIENLDWFNIDADLKRLNKISADMNEIVWDGAMRLDVQCSWDNGNDLFEGEETKWYEWQRDMTKLSKKHPDVRFRLDGVGEEQGDVWQAEFWNGQYRRREQVYSWGEWKGTWQD